MRKIEIGFDRFIPLEFADYSLELYLSSNDERYSVDMLRSYLQNQIKGNETARKTGDQLKRLWLIEDDENNFLRTRAKECIINNKLFSYPIFHFGMALNTYPIFLLTCEKIGVIANSNPIIFPELVINRVSETFPNPTSIPRIVHRVLQTLLDWDFLIKSGKGYISNKIIIEDSNVNEWFIQALLFAIGSNNVSMRDLISNPLLLGIDLSNIRNLLTFSDHLTINRDYVNINTK